MKNLQKKILLFTRPLAPPWDEASKNLAFEIAKNIKQPFEIHALTTRQFCGKFSQDSVELQGKKIVAEPIFEKPSFGISEKIALIKRLLLLDSQTDLVHFLFTPRKLTSWLIRLKLTTIKTKTIQTVATISEEIYGNIDFLKKICFADQIVAQSNFTKNRLRMAGLKNVSMIYPGIDLGKFVPAPKDVKFLQKHAIGSQDFVVLFAGEYGRLNAIDNILGALEFLSANQPSRPFKLVMACRIKSKQDKIIKQQFVDKASNFGYDKHVVFIDFCEEMEKLYNATDVQIFPVRKMAGKFDIPFVLIEQMACKKPVIVSDLNVLLEFVKNNENGLVVKKNSPFQFGKAILDLLNSPENLSRLGENAQRYVHENFDIKKNINKYEKLYLKVAKANL